MLLARKSLSQSIIIGLFAVNTVVFADSQLILSNGDKISGEIITETDTAVTILHPVLGEVSIEKTKLTSIIDTEDAEEAVIAAEVVNEADIAPDEAVVVDAGIFNTGFLIDWKRRFDVGIGGSSGNSNSNQMNVGFAADYEDEQTRIDHKTAYFRAESDGDETDNNLYSYLNRDWLIPDSPWLYFARGRFDWDRYKDWDYRISGGAGAGYDFINNDKWQLTGRAGLGFYQTISGEREEFMPEGLLGVDAKYTFNEFHHIAFSNTFSQGLKEEYDYRNYTTLDWVLDLDSILGVALIFGVTNEYDSAASGDTEKNDLKYLASLAWKL